MKDPQQPGGQLNGQFRMTLTGAVEAALWTKPESCSGDNMKEVWLCAFLTDPV